MCVLYVQKIAGSFFGVLSYVPAYYLPTCIQNNGQLLLKITFFFKTFCRKYCGPIYLKNIQAFFASMSNR